MAKTEAPTERGSVAIVGAGAVATSLGLALVQAGFRVASVTSAIRADAGRLAILTGASHSGDTLADVPDDFDAMFLCVPDDAIGTVSGELAAAGLSWRGRLVAHTSGSRTATELRSVGEHGAHVASFHPLQSFPHGGPIKTFNEVHVGLEGSDEAVAVAERIALAIGARPFRIPADLKRRYHLAATVASNYVTTLMAVVDELIASASSPAASGELRAELFVPLVRESLDNVARVGAVAALTGPIARGDVGTLSAHLEELRATAAHLLPAYAALATEAVRVAVRGGHIAPEIGENLLDVVAAAVAHE